MAEATNLHKFVPLEHRRLPSRQASGSDKGILEDHLLSDSKLEIATALDNGFIPLMMVPEAAEYSATHQTM